MRELIIVARYWLAIKLLTWVCGLMQRNNAPLWLAAYVAVIVEGISEEIAAVQRTVERQRGR